MRNKIRVLLLDDHPLIKVGLKKVISGENDMEICGEASSATQAISMMGQCQSMPDVALVDITLEGDIDGIEFIKVLRSRYKNIRSLVLSLHEEPSFVERSIMAGARGYVLKREPFRTIIEAIRLIAADEMYFSPGISGPVLKRMCLKSNYCDDEKGPLARLTVREHEIFHFIGLGYKTSEIARELSLSSNTIESHRRKIKEKLGVEKSSDLMKLAIRIVSRKDLPG